MLIQICLLQTHWFKKHERRIRISQFLYELPGMACATMTAIVKIWLDLFRFMLAIWPGASEQFGNDACVYSVEKNYAPT